MDFTNLEELESLAKRILDPMVSGTGMFPRGRPGLHTLSRVHVHSVSP